MILLCSTMAFPSETPQSCALTRLAPILTAQPAMTEVWSRRIPAATRAVQVAWLTKKIKLEQERVYAQTTAPFPETFLLATYRSQRGGSRRPRQCSDEKPSDSRWGCRSCPKIQTGSDPSPRVCSGPDTAWACRSPRDKGPSRCWSCTLAPTWQAR